MDEEENVGPHVVLEPHVMVEPLEDTNTIIPVQSWGSEQVQTAVIQTIVVIITIRITCNQQYTTGTHPCDPCYCALCYDK